MTIRDFVTDILGDALAVAIMTLVAVSIRHFFGFEVALFATIAYTAARVNSGFSRIW